MEIFSFIGPDKYNKNLSGMAGNTRMPHPTEAGMNNCIFSIHYCVLFSLTQTFRPKRMLKVIILNRMKGPPNNVGTCKTSWELQSIRLSIPGVMWVRGPNNVRRSVQRIQHCCAALRRSRSKRKVGSRWLKSLNGLKLCATTPNNMQQGMKRYATCNIQ